MAQGLLRQFSGLFNDLGRLVGYRNPTNGQDENGFLQVLAQSAVPFILAGGTAGGSSNQFTMGNNGAISTLPVLPTTYSGGAFLYMPANGIFAGSTAGWYWFVASSTTAGTVYNNQYFGGDPKAAVPAVPTPFVSTGPGVVTQATTAINAATVPVPGGTLGPNGVLRSTARFEANNNANAKTVSSLFGTASVAGAMASNVTGGMLLEVRAMNSQQRQVVQPRSFGAAYGGSTNASVYTTDDHTQTQNWYTTLQLSATTDFLILVGFDVSVQYGA